VSRRCRRYLLVRIMGKRKFQILVQSWYLHWEVGCGLTDRVVKISEDERGSKL
jgi:hypothetical protein